MVYCVNDRGEVLIPSDLTLVQQVKLVMQTAGSRESEKTSLPSERTAR